MHTQYNKYTQYNCNNTHGQTSNNYTQENLKLATIHKRRLVAKGTFAPIIGKVEVGANAPPSIFDT